MRALYDDDDDCDGDDGWGARWRVGGDVFGAVSAPQACSPEVWGLSAVSSLWAWSETVAGV